MEIKNISPEFVENDTINKHNYVHPVNSAGICVNGKEIDISQS